MRNVKILILGGSNVGKTSLIHQLLFKNRPHPNGLIPTIEDVYFATIESAQDAKILLLDVAGVKQNIDIESLRNYISLADEFILVYSINERSTFNLVDKIKKLIDQTKGKRDRPIIVLGNKVDLDIQRQVGFDEGLIWAKRENIKLFEVTSFERATLGDFSKFLASQLTSTQPPSSSFKLKRTKTYQSSG